MPNPWKLTTIFFATTTALGIAFAEPQPTMRDALSDLRAAANRLEKAERDKGGHREKALELTRSAIHEVEEGIRFDNRH
jgi:hypothetical protein